jgi:hypothetical protein
MGKPSLMLVSHLPDCFSWFHRRYGVRLEFRGFIQAATTGSSQVKNVPRRFYSVRAGIAFR